MAQRLGSTALAAAALNRDAGSHLVTTDPKEIRACRRAGQRSWAEFPYYEARFAARGERFCTSDTAWLVTLCDLEIDRTIEQVRWLGRVLSSRGMPQYLLECHLQNLHHELVAATPRRHLRYASLRHALRDLGKRRRTQLGGRNFRQIVSRFEADVAPLSERIDRMGEVIASAVADEGLGIANAVLSVEAWACDTSRFSPAWIDAVRAAVSASRARRAGG